MNVVRSRSLGLGVGAVVLALGALATPACGGDSDGPPATAPGTSTGGKQPPASSGDPTTSTEERTYAVQTIALGDATRAGVKDDNAWKTFGYDLDKLVTNVPNSDAPDLAKVCKRVAKAPATIHQDGDQGVDNAFGKGVIGLFNFFTTTPSKTVGDSLAAGTFTILLKLKGLTADPAQTNTGLSGSILIGSDFDPSTTDPAAKKRPTFTTADDWPYNREPQIPITNAYVKDGVFVSAGSNAALQLSLPIGGEILTFAVNRPIITFKHGADDSLEEGTIAGVVDSEAFATSIGTIAGRLLPSVCGTPTIEGIKDGLRQASDIIADGSQDPNKTCSGISIGIGFTAKRVANPTKPVDPPAPPAPACP